MYHGPARAGWTRVVASGYVDSSGSNEDDARDGKKRLTEGEQRELVEAGPSHRTFRQTASVLKGF
jgi:hypothetical protein